MATAPLSGFFSARLGGEDLWVPEDFDFKITTELDSIPRFDCTIQNSSGNRTIIDNHLADNFELRREGITFFTGAINCDSIEYLSETRTKLSGFASWIDLGYELYKRMADADAENVDTVLVRNAGGSPLWADYTTEANNDTINDVVLVLDSANDGLYIGQDEPFFTIKIKYSTKGIQSGTPIWTIKYSTDGGSWSTLDCIDETRYFTEDASTYFIIIPNKPSDWGKKEVNSVEKFWVRLILTSGSYTTPPKLDRIWISQTDVCRVQFDNIAADTIFNYVLDGTDYSEDATDQCPSDLISIRGEYMSKLQWIAGIVNALTWEDGNGDKQPYDWWIDSSDKVHVKQIHGSDQGAVSTDLLMLNNKEGYFDMANRIFGLGSFDGINQCRAAVENQAAQDTYKLREAYLQDARIANYTPLKEFAQKSLTTLQAPLEICSCELDTKNLLDNSIDVGDTITINQPAWNVDNVDYRIMRISYDKSKAKLDIGIARAHLDNLQADMQRQVDISDVWMHGATNIYQVGPIIDNFERVNDSTVYPLKMLIYIPDEAIKINKVLLNWSLDGYRTYSTVASSKDLGGKTSSDDGDDVLTSGVKDFANFNSLYTGVDTVQTIAEADVNSTGGETNLITGWIPTSIYQNVNVQTMNSGCFSNSACLNGVSIPNNVSYCEVAKTAHIHKTDIPVLLTEDSDTHMHTVDVPNHTHSVTIPAHHHTVTLGSHEHDLDYGIMEESSSAPVMELKVGSETVGSNYSGNMTKVNIAGYMSLGWNTITLQPKVSENKRGRAQIDCIAQVFIQSK